jgi:predicted nucleotidyltransferase
MQRQGLADLGRRFGLRLVVAFGSRVTGRAHPDSDLDVAILPSQAPVSFATLADISAELSRLFRGVEIDIGLIPRADPLFLKKIFETGQLLVGDQRLFADYRVYAHRRYGDYLPYLRLETEATRRMIAVLRHAG